MCLEIIDQKTFVNVKSIHIHQKLNSEGKIFHIGYKLSLENNYKKKKRASLIKISIVNYEEPY